jgi:two-component system sensor histidine kinase YesM
VERLWSRRRRSVRSTLFATYLLLIVLSTAFLTIFSYSYTANLMTRAAINALRDVSSSVVDAMDAELLKMNSVSVAIASSDLVRQLVKARGTAPAGEGAASRLAAYRNAAAIVDVMQSIIGPYKPVPQVNLYTLSGEMIGAGVYSQAAQVPYREVPWLAGGVDTSSGGTRFSRPHRDALLGRTQALYEGRSYLSMYRTFFDQSRSPIGVLEVKQFVDTIFRGFSTLSGRAIVFDPTWFQIYPLEGQAQPSVPAALRTARDGEILTLRDPRTGARQIGIVAFSQQADWRVAVLQEQRLLLAPVRRFASVILLTGAVLAAAAVLVASRLAARITVPLGRIHDALRGLDWDALARDGGPAAPAAEVGELEELEAAFHGMRASLRRSMNEALEARAHETKATLLALQSQMDPHFVYNMLTTIGIMAEEGMRREIAESIGNMTHLLRYISSGKSNVVTLGDEVEYARRYLACMKTRFRENLSFSIEVPKQLLEVSVPKLIIQPIIENAVKYGLAARPPWCITITGRHEGNGGVRRWSVSVADNGPGFHADKLHELASRLSSRSASEADASLAISGMGLLNIATRLAIFYGSEAVCTAANRPGGGAVVTIGGTHEPKTSLVGPGR